MKAFTLTLALLASPCTVAAPFLVCDPYPAEVGQPKEFVVTFTSPAATVPPLTVVSPAVPVTGGVALQLDLAPLTLKGPQTVTAKARNAWGDSGASAPYTFTPGMAAPPKNLHLALPSRATTGTPP